MQQNYSYQRTATQYSSNQQSSNNPPVLVNSGLTDRDGAKQVAKRILDTYDRDRNGVIDSIEVVPMIVDAYKSFNRVFSPSRADIESYLKILDRNGDGRVTIQDLEDLCTKYLTQKIWSLNSIIASCSFRCCVRIFRNLERERYSLSSSQNFTYVTFLFFWEASVHQISCAVFTRVSHGAPASTYSSFLPSSFIRFIYFRPS